MAVALPEFVTGNCPLCGAKQALVVVEHEEVIDHPDISGSTKYSVLRCGGCGQHYFKSSGSNSEDVEYRWNESVRDHLPHYVETVEFWPRASDRRPPDWLWELQVKDRRLWRLFKDVFVAMSNDLRTLAAIAMRTTFDRAAELLDVDPSLGFDQKLEELKASGLIVEREQKILAVLIDAGSAAAHRGWEPTHKQLEGMVTLLESFLHRSFLLEEISDDLKAKVPPKPKKKKPKTRT